MNVQKIKI